MKTLAAIALSSVASLAFAAQTPRCVGGSTMAPKSVRTVAPALERYTHERLLGEVWRRPGLSVRDRSLVTLAVLIARSQSVEMPYYLNQALENGVKPSEISEIVTHLAFYSGWGNAMSAVPAAKEVFARRGVKADDLPASTPTLLPLNE